MSDFFSSFWSYYIAIGTLAGIAFCTYVLTVTNKGRPAPSTNPQLHGHVWDGDLQEYNNPLPLWWMWMFYVAIIFAVGYIILYPGLGGFAGTLGWSSKGQFNDEQQQAAEKYGPIFDKFAKQDLRAIVADPQAREMGQRLFLNYCAQCHGSDAQGAKGFPNLADKDWLYGGDPETIRKTITDGRNGIMPAWGKKLSADDIKDVTYYVLSLSGFPSTPVQISSGKKVFMNNCAACHGAEAKGNHAVGAPNLTDKTWLHGGSIATVTETITKGRSSQMPVHKDLLGEAKINLLAAYVYGLSNETNPEIQK
ncbi:MAG: cytochrome-c oxidase, cbb3-type subunit III [Pseudomonadota bacterium]